MPILNEINPKHSLEEAPIFQPPDAKSRLIKKTMKLGKIESRKRGQQRMKRLDGVTNSKDRSLRKLPEMVKERKPGVL